MKYQSLFSKKKKEKKYILKCHLLKFLTIMLLTVKSQWPFIRKEADRLKIVYKLLKYLGIFKWFQFIYYSGWMYVLNVS